MFVTTFRLNYVFPVKIIVPVYIYFTAPIPKAYDPADYYFVGALIALSSAIFSAANNIVISLVCMKQNQRLGILLNPD